MRVINRKSVPLKVKDVFKVLGGGTPSTAVPEYWTGPIPWITSADLDDDLKINARKKISRKAISASTTNLVPAGSVVVATRVGLGKVGIAESDLCFSQDCQGLVSDQRTCDSKFAAHQLKQSVQIFKHISRGTTISGVTKKQLLELPFWLPSINEQKKIVSKLESHFSRLNEGVEALKRVQANLKRFRASVLKAACEGRLVPTEAELARKEKRSYETGAQLLERILKERRAAWEKQKAKEGRNKKYVEPAPPDTSNLPDLPEGWVWASIELISILVQYGSSAKTRETGLGVPVLRMGNIEDGKVVMESIKYLPLDHYEFPNLILKKGDLLFNRTNSAELVGKTAVYYGDPSPCSFASYLIQLRLTGGYLPDFLSYFINSVFGRAWITQVVSQQVGQANVNGTKLQARTVPLPPLAEQRRIVAAVKRLIFSGDGMEHLVRAKIQSATDLQKAIMTQAFHWQVGSEGDGI